MATLTELMKVEPIRAAIWGVSGSAKTTLAGMMAQYEEFRPIYFFDWDRRIAALRARIPKELWQYIHADTYSDGDGYQGSAWTKAEAKVARLEQEGWKTVVWDSMTFALDGMMARVLMLDGNKPATFNPQLQHYLSQQSLTKDIVGKLCSKKFHFVCTFHEGTDKDEITGALFKAFAVTGKLAERIPGFFNEIWHTEISQQAGKDPQFTVRTRSNAIHMARTTFRTLQSVENQSEIWPKVLKEYAEWRANPPVELPAAANK